MAGGNFATTMKLRPAMREFVGKVKATSPSRLQPPMSRSTAIWLYSSTHSKTNSLVAGWYMISLNTSVVSARAGKTAAQSSPRAKQSRFMDLGGLTAATVTESSHADNLCSDRWRQNDGTAEAIAREF